MITTFTQRNIALENVASINQMLEKLTDLYLLNAMPKKDYETTWNVLYRNHNELLKNVQQFEKTIQDEKV